MSTIFFLNRKGEAVPFSTKGLDRVPMEAKEFFAKKRCDFPSWEVLIRVNRKVAAIELEAKKRANPYEVYQVSRALFERLFQSTLDQIIDENRSSHSVPQSSVR